MAETDSKQYDRRPLARNRAPRRAQPSFGRQYSSTIYSTRRRLTTGVDFRSPLAVDAKSVGSRNQYGRDGGSRLRGALSVWFTVSPPPTTRLYRAPRSNGITYTSLESKVWILLIMKTRVPVRFSIGFAEFLVHEKLHFSGYGARFSPEVIC